MSTEEKHIKDAYHDTNKALESENKVCGIVSRPGLEFRSKVVFAHCPHCNSNGPTDVQAFWSVKNYLCCYYYGAYWRCLQLIRGKDYFLKDAVHKCSSCQQEIARYEAC